MVIAKTGFYTSVISYLVFLLAEYCKPGFVSNHMSVHWFLFAAIVFAIWWSKNHNLPKSGRPVIFWTISILFGLLAAILVWQVGADFQEFRILSLILAFLLPLTVLGVLRSRT